MMTDAYNSDTLSEHIEALAKDHSHITRKIYQTLGYLMFMFIIWITQSMEMQKIVNVV